MISLDVIRNKITSLGGVKQNPLCRSDEALQVNDSFVLELEKKFANSIPDLYKGTIQFFGPFSFQKSIKVECQDLNPAADENNKVTVDYFYSLASEGECSINKLLSTFSDQLPSYLLPICDGKPGDLICIDLRPVSYETIYYWFHEAEVGKDLFRIASNFVEFILKLEIFEENNEENEKEPKVQIKASDKLLEMLKKSGYGPKE